MGKRLHVTVMLGGPSAEREVSLRSGAAVAGALRGLGHEVAELDPRGEGWALPTKTDVVFLALHGTYGEDGTVQRALDRLGVPYTGCDADSSQAAFDKVVTKNRCEAAGIVTPRHVVVRDPRSPWPEGWRPPVVLKPVRQGSSVGLSFVRDASGWSEALAVAGAHGMDVLVEEQIVGSETTVGLLAGSALPVVEIRPRHGGYDYRNKYTAGATDYLCPAPFPPGTTRRIQDAAAGAFRAIGGRDYGRVDVMVDEAGNPWVLEVNTLPGMTETSLLPKAAAAAGIDFPSLCQTMVDLALHRKTNGSGPG
jgi:D-alanine-D-alanine ligase